MLLALGSVLSGQKWTHMPARWTDSGGTQLWQALVFPSIPKPKALLEVLGALVWFCFLRRGLPV